MFFQGCALEDGSHGDGEQNLHSKDIGEEGRGDKQGECLIAGVQLLSKPVVHGPILSIISSNNV